MTDVAMVWCWLRSLWGNALATERVSLLVMLWFIGATLVNLGHSNHSGVTFSLVMWLIGQHYVLWSQVDTILRRIEQDDITVEYLELHDSPPYLVEDHHGADYRYVPGAGWVKMHLRR